MRATTANPDPSRAFTFRFGWAGNRTPYVAYILLYRWHYQAQGFTWPAVLCRLGGSCSGTSGTKILGVDLAKDLYNSNIVKAIRKVLPSAPKRTSLLPTYLTFPKHFGVSIKYLMASDLADHTEITKVLKSEHEKTKIRRWTVEYIF